MLTRLTLTVLLLSAFACFSQNTCVPTGDNVSWSQAASWSSCGGTIPQSVDTVSFGANQYNVNMDGAGSVTVAAIQLGAKGMISNADANVTLTVNGNASYAPNGTTVRDTFHFTAGNIYINGAYAPTSSFASARRWYHRCSASSYCNIGGTTGTLVYASNTFGEFYGVSSLDWKYVHLANVGPSPMSGWSGGTVDKTPVITMEDVDCLTCNSFWGYGGGNTTLRRVYMPNTPWGPVGTGLVEYTTLRSLFCNSDCTGSNGVSGANFTIRHYYGYLASPTPTFAETNNIFVSVGWAYNVNWNVVDSIILYDFDTGDPGGLTYSKASGNISGSMALYTGISNPADLGTFVFPTSAVTSLTFTGNLVPVPPNGVAMQRIVEGMGNPAPVLVDHNTVDFSGEASNTGTVINHGHSGSNQWASIGKFSDNLVFSDRGGYWLAYDMDQAGRNSSCSAYTQYDSNMAAIGNNYVWPVITNNAESGSCNTNSAHGYGGKWSSTPPGMPDVAANPRFVDTKRHIVAFPTQYLKITGNAASGATWAAGRSYTDGEYVTNANSGVLGNAPLLYKVIYAHTSFTDATPGGASVSVGNQVASIIGNGTTITVTMNAGHPHNLSVGQYIYWNNSVMEYWKINSAVATVPDALTFTVNGTFNGTAASGKSFTLWRSFYEYGVKDVIQKKTPLGAVYVDGALDGCTSVAPCSAIQVMRKWAYSGYTPSNPALWCSATDNKSIGAVDVCVRGRAMLAASAF